MIRAAVQSMRQTVRKYAKRAGQILGMASDIYYAIGGSRSCASAMSGVRVDSDSALTVSAYTRGAQLIASYIGRTPFHVKEGEKKAKTHPAWRIIRKWAQHHQLSAFEFRRTMTFIAATRGNAYAFIERDGLTAQPVNLWILDPSRVEPYLKNKTLWYRFEGNPRAYPASDVFHIRGVTTDGYIGLDPIKTHAREVLGLALAQNQYASQYYKSGGLPQMYVYSEHVLQEEHYQKLKSESGPLARSMETSNSLPILDGVELRTLGVNAEQTQILQAREFTLKEVANVLNITVHKLNGEGTGGYKSVEEENRAFRDDTLEPWFVQFECEYEKLLTEAEQSDGTHSIEAIRESLTRSNMADRAKYLQTAVGGPWMTPGEAREVDSLETIDGTDQLYPPPNMTRPDGAAADAGTGGDTGGGRSTLPANELRHVPDPVLQVAALADVYGRMIRRLTTAGRKAADKPEAFTAFLETLSGNHSRTIRSAFRPVVALCGGGSGDTVADALLLTVCSRLSALQDTANASAAVVAECDRLEAESELMARQAVESWTC